MRRPIPAVRQLTGVVVATGSGLGVNIAGSVHTNLALPASVIVTEGDVVSVDVVNGRGRVTGVVTLGARPLTGTAGAAAGGMVPVTTTAGVVWCRYSGSAPTPGNTVRIQWDANPPWVWPAVPQPVVSDGGAPSVVTPPTPKPPPVVSTGVLYVAASGSGAYTSSLGWASPNPTQGTSSGKTWTGSWFYGSRPGQLRGRTVTKIMFRLPPQMGMGLSSHTIGLYRHTSRTRPSGTVGVVDGPYNVTSSKSPRWITLPTSWGQAFVDSGGGILMSGSTYVSVFGITLDATSGQLAISWRG